VFTAGLIYLCLLLGLYTCVYCWAYILVFTAGPVLVFIAGLIYLCLLLGLYTCVYCWAHILVFIAGPVLVFIAMLIYLCIYRCRVLGLTCVYCRAIRLLGLPLLYTCVYCWFLGLRRIVMVIRFVELSYLLGFL
jgi:hypothetical protein